MVTVPVDVTVRVTVTATVLGNGKCSGACSGNGDGSGKCITRGYPLNVTMRNYTTVHMIMGLSPPPAAP